MASHFAKTLIRLRWWIVAGWVALATGLAALAPATDPVANELLTFLPDDSPSVQAAEALKKHFPDSAGLSQAAIVIERAGGGGRAAASGSRPASSSRLTAADLAWLNRLARKLGEPLPAKLAELLPTSRLPVRYPGQFPPLLGPNPLISADGSAAIAVVEVPANFVTIRSARVVNYVRGVVAGESAARPAGLDVAVTGSAAFGRDYAAASERSHKRTLWVTVVAVLVILLIVFRAPLASGVLLGTISLAAIVAHFALGIGTALGLHVGTAERIFVFVLLYGVGVDYSLLYLARFREFIAADMDPHAAAAAAWRVAAPAIGASSGTDIAGLAMLSAAAFKIFQTTGCVVPIALFIALAAALTLVPAAVAILHRWLFWPGSRIGHLGSERLWAAVAGAVTRRPRTVLLVTVAVLVIPAVVGARLSYVYDALTGLESRYGAVRGLEMAQRHWPVGQISPATVLLEADTAAARAGMARTVERLTEAIAKTEGVDDVRSLSRPVGLGRKGPPTATARRLLEALNPLTGLRRAALLRLLARRDYLAGGGSAARLVVVMDSPGFSNRAMETLERIRQTCRADLPAGATLHFAGATAEMADIRNVTRRDFYLIAVLALAVVFAIVTLLLRDALLSAFMVAATVLSYLATLGVAQAFFVGLLGAEGLDWKVQVFLFVVLVAVGQDYNIFLAARLAEESVGGSVRSAARTALVKTGAIISSAGLIMAATLGSLMAGEITLLVQLGFAFAVGMLLDTFVVRPLLLPAFAVLTGRTGRPITRRR